MITWLLLQSVRQQIEDGRRSGFTLSADQRAQFEAAHTLSAASSSRVLTVAGDTAEVAIKGVLTSSPDIFAMLFGGGNTTYREIISAVAEAEADPSVKNIDLAIDSPGGTIDGLFDTVAALQAAKKPIRAVVSNLAASAAYALAAQAGEIVATNRAARFGSIGIVAGFHVSDDVIEVTSTEAPKKRPDVRTEEGVAAVREELDALHEIFSDAIATGRDTTVEKVNAEFGRGAVLLADKALKLGMIDGVRGANLSVVASAASNPSASSGGKQSETGPMDLQTLKAQHPDVYATAVQEGVDKERDRVAGHLNLAQGSGLMDDAIAAINDGSDVTQAAMTKHMMAAVNRGSQTARDADETTISAAADGAQAPAADADAESEQVAALVEAQFGIGGDV